MVFIHHRRWYKELQPKFSAEYLTAGFESMDEYLNVTHEFTPLALYKIGDDSEYGIMLFFNDAEEEVIFRLKYEIK